MVAVIMYYNGVDFVSSDENQASKLNQAVLSVQRLYQALCLLVLHSCGIVYKRWRKANWPEGPVFYIRQIALSWSELHDIRPFQQKYLLCKLMLPFQHQNEFINKILFTYKERSLVRSDELSLQMLKFGESNI